MTVTKTTYFLLIFRFLAAFSSCLSVCLSLFLPHAFKSLSVFCFLALAFHFFCKGQNILFYPSPLKRPASDLRCKIIHDVLSASVRVYQVTPSCRCFCTAVPNCVSYNDTVPRSREVGGLNLSSVSLYPASVYSGYSRVFGVV